MHHLNFARIWSLFCTAGTSRLGDDEISGATWVACSIMAASRTRERAGYSSGFMSGFAAETIAGHGFWFGCGTSWPWRTRP